MRRLRKQSLGRLEIAETSVRQRTDSLIPESGLVIAESSSLGLNPVPLTPALRHDLAQIFFAVQTYETQNGQPVHSVDDSPQVAIERLFKEEPDHTPQPLPLVIRNGHKQNGTPVPNSVKARQMAALVSDTAEVIMVPLLTVEDCEGIPEISNKIPGEPLL